MELRTDFCQRRKCGRLAGQILAELAAADPRVRVINFSRNFGHEAAMLAGLDHSIGEGIVCMDADLQHPPECVAQIIEKIRRGL